MSRMSDNHKAVTRYRQSLAGAQDKRDRAAASARERHDAAITAAEGRLRAARDEHAAAVLAARREMEGVITRADREAAGTAAAALHALENATPVLITRNADRVLEMRLDAGLPVIGRAAESSGNEWWVDTDAGRTFVGGGEQAARAILLEYAARELTPQTVAA